MGVKQSTPWLARILLPITALAIAGCSDSSNGPELVPDTPAATNILFVVLDDIGVDQLEVFGLHRLPRLPLPRSLVPESASQMHGLCLPAQPLVA